MATNRGIRLCAPSCFCLFLWRRRSRGRVWCVVLSTKHQNTQQPLRCFASAAVEMPRMLSLSPFSHSPLQVTKVGDPTSDQETVWQGLSRVSGLQQQLIQALVKSANCVPRAAQESWLVVSGVFSFCLQRWTLRAAGQKDLPNRPDNLKSEKV